MAKLCALRLLRELPGLPPPALRCICFATPAMGNGALADLVEHAGWSAFFKTYFLPGAKRGLGRWEAVTAGRWGGEEGYAYVLA